MNDLETLESYWSAEEAQLSKNLLESEGIPCFLAGEATSTMLWHLANATGGVRLQVRRCDLERAESILQASRQSSETAETGQDFRSAGESDRDLREGVDSDDVPAQAAAENDRYDQTQIDDDLDQTSSPGLFENFRKFRVLILLPILIGPIIFFTAILISIIRLIAMQVMGV